METAGVEIGLYLRLEGSSSLALWRPLSIYCVSTDTTRKSGSRANTSSLGGHTQTSTFNCPQLGFGIVTVSVVAAPGGAVTGSDSQRVCVGTLHPATPLPLWYFGCWWPQVQAAQGTRAEALL